jgi:endonuclease V-like protein UPF0215 family
MVKTGFPLFLLPEGITWSDAGKLIDAFTQQGRIPEPIRVAQIIAREIYRWQLPYKQEPID